MIEASCIAKQDDFPGNSTEILEAFRMVGSFIEKETKSGINNFIQNINNEQAVLVNRAIIYRYFERHG